MNYLMMETGPMFLSVLSGILCLKSTNEILMMASSGSMKYAFWKPC